MQNLGDLHDLYAKTNVLLLVDTFENFRRLSLQYYKIDAAQLYASSGFSRLKISQIVLEHFRNVNMLFFIEKGIRDRVSLISA